MSKRVSRRQFLGASVATGAAAMVPFQADAAEARKVISSMQETPAGRRVTLPVLNTRDVEERLNAVVGHPVYKMVVVPNWFADNDKFWYRNDLSKGRREFVLVDAVRGKRTAAFDHTKLAVGLGKAVGTLVDPDRLPFDQIVLDPNVSTVRFDIGSSPFLCTLVDYKVEQLPNGTPPVAPPSAKGPASPQNSDDDDSPATDLSAVSPDGKFTASIVNSNVAITDQSGRQRLFTTDGTPLRPYGSITWSPDSSTIVAYLIDPAEIKSVYMVESSPTPWNSRGILHHHEYAQAGDPFSAYQMYLFNVASGSKIKANVDVIDFGDAPSLNWDDDSRRFSYEYMNRGYQRFRIIAVDVSTGSSINLVDDSAPTFIDSTNIYTWYSDDKTEIVYLSERDGWRHIYLFDGRSGALKGQLTSGQWVVRGIDSIDQSSRQILFSASGKNTGEDPYHQHKYVVSFDGSGLTSLTGGNGDHRITFSPDSRFLIDTYSRADLPPVNVLRSGQSGKYVCALETADVSELTAAGWRPPQVFSAKGRDGVTDIWGVVYRPFGHQASGSYPVIENIYAGPQDSYVRKTFTAAGTMQAQAELGFIVVQIDGMGTRNRSKAFHDVCWRNLKDAGFPDRILWIKALAGTDPTIDISRVGIYGTSAGGQNSTGALLFHPEFYKAAVSSCGCHDNRVDKQWWNEQWMGYPVGPWYAECSNIENAHRLRGKLLLIVGELDTNVPPESTIRLTNELIKSGKDYELIVIPGSDHTDGGEYGERRRRDFFIRSLLGMEPPDRNVPEAPLASVVLTAMPPGEASNADASGGSATTIKFVNRTKETVSIFWVSGDAPNRFYASIAPGDSYLEHTYVDHYWLVVGADGRPMAVYVGSLAPGIANIRD